MMAYVLQHSGQDIVFLSFIWGYNLLVMKYDDPNILDTLATHADELAAIVIEPIQPVHACSNSAKHSICTEDPVELLLSYLASFRIFEYYNTFIQSYVKTSFIEMEINVIVGSSLAQQYLIQSTPGN